MQRTVLITGGSKGIGFAMLTALLEAGYTVANLSRTRPVVPEHLARSLVQLPCDLGDPVSLAAALTWLDSRSDELHGVIHSACAYGSTGRRPISETTREEWDSALNVNARAFLLLLQRVVPLLTRQEHGRIVAISSDIATQPGPGRVPYAASKAAAHAILQGLAKELKDTGVYAVELSPTHQVDTPGIRSRRPADFQPDGYASASSFGSPILHLMNCNLAPLHGRCLLVDPGGQLLAPDGSPVR